MTRYATLTEKVQLTSQALSVNFMHKQIVTNLMDG